MKQLIKMFGICCLAATFTGCLKDEPLKLPYQGFEPVVGDDGWEITTPEAQNMDRDLVEKACQLLYENDRFLMARSLLVIRHGKLVAEVYPHGEEDAQQIQNLQSITKSFVSVLAGIALQEGWIDSVEQTFSSIYPDAMIDHPEKSGITIRDALTMRTGIDFSNNSQTLPLYLENGSSISNVLSRPCDYEPGIIFHYHDGAPHLVSYALQCKSGQTMSELARERLFEPLGIRNWKWEVAQDGVTFGAFGLYLRPRDAARFGQLLLQNGQWKGESLVDSTWIAEATRPHVTAVKNGASYGYYFWIFPAEGAYAAIGHGGQYLYMVPSKNLLIVYTAWPYSDDDYFDKFHELANLLLHSCG